MNPEILANPEITPVGFADCYMGLSDLADWQCRAVMPVMDARVGQKRVQITVAAPNGSGKDTRIIPVAAYWWLFMYPKGRVVITSASDTQITKQTIPAIREYYEAFGWPQPVDSPRFTLKNGQKGELIAFTTNKAGRIEGWHERKDSPLLLIVNEAKTVDYDLFTGLDRCTPTCIIYISSTGLEEGRFWETHEKIPGWIRIRAGLKDCPWIPQEKIDSVIATYGPDDPMTRSILHGEFMSQADDEYFCLTKQEFDNCMDAPPIHIPGFRYGFWDFADGRAKNVFVVRNGNKYEIVDSFREKNEDAVVGRAIYLMKQSGLKPQQIGGDAAAKSILDKLATGGWPINRFNFGRTLGPTNKTLYKSWSVFAWIEGSNKIKRREVILPGGKYADLLRQQITSRRKLYTPLGQIALEKKEDMKEERGIESPDEADALFGAMAQQDNSLLVPNHPSSLKEIFDNNRPNFRRGSRVGL